jgi:OmcA/MtrC family decaheme c-type cytochrome
VLVKGATKKTEFTIHDKEYYAAPNILSFVRPGLVITIVSANVAQDGTISVDYKLTDPKGLALDQAGVTTPGPISLSFLCAYIPKGQTQFYAYTTRIQTSTITNVSAVQASTDSGGTTKQVGDGEYVYTFKTKAVAQGGGAWDPTATHRMGIYGSRNLTEFDLGSNYDDATASWVPAGGTPTNNRDVIRTATCNKCHDSLAAHGGSRKDVDLCVMCHQPQTTDPDTGNSVDMKVFIHKLHMGSQLPSVIAGKPYQIIGFSGVSDWSTVVLPSDPRRCAFCHEPQSVTGAAQANNWLTQPNRAACGSCHDDVNFTTGQNHVNLPQADDSQCTQCHIPASGYEFDASIQGAHTVPTETAANPGLVFNIVKVDKGVAGQKPVVTFTMKDFKGNGVTNTQLAATGSGARLSLVLAGPTSDYGYTSFGSDVTTPGYVSESALTAGQCSPDGTCTYTFLHAIPANAKGTYSIGMEGRNVVTINPGTVIQQTVNIGAKNVIAFFSVDGSTPQPRRTVVDINNCNKCHATLSLHGGNRNQITQCVLCHNPSNTAPNPAPGQAINFALMVHKIHTGETLGEAGLSYKIDNTEFNDVRYPAMGPTGATADTAKCYMCHTNGSEAVFPIGKNNVLDPQGLLTPAPATTSACTACHFAQSALAHAQTQTDPKFGETCDVCHSSGAAFDVVQVHAGQ